MRCALLGEVVPASARANAILRSLLRASLFIPGAALALGAAANSAYFGVDAVLVLLFLSLVPGAVACWVAASCGRHGDRWPAGYAATWVVVLLLLPWAFGALGILHH